MSVGSLCFSSTENGTLFSVIVVRVDDFIIAGDKATSDATCTVLKQRFPTKNLAKILWYTGCEYVRDIEAGTSMVTQEAFIEKVVALFDISRNVPISAAPHVNPRTKKDHENEGSSWPFREVVGSLTWIANQTWRDIANTVRAVARNSQNPKEVNWKAARKILEYFKLTSKMGLRFEKGNDLDVMVFAD